MGDYFSSEPHNLALDTDINDAIPFAFSDPTSLQRKKRSSPIQELAGSKGSLIINTDMEANGFSSESPSSDSASFADPSSLSDSSTSFDSPGAAASPNSTRKSRRNAKALPLTGSLPATKSDPSFRLNAFENNLDKWGPFEGNFEGPKANRFQHLNPRNTSKIQGGGQFRRSVSMENLLGDSSARLPMNLREVKQWLRKNSNPDRQNLPLDSILEAVEKLQFDEGLSNASESVENCLSIELPAIRNVEHLCALLDFYEDANTLTSLGWKAGEIPGLDIDSIQEIMQLLQSELDSTDHDLDTLPTAYHKQCLRCLRRLTQIYQVLPTSLNLQDVTRHGQNPVAGGGFADIWRGTLQGQPVCLKVLRIIIEQDEDVRVKIRKQFCKEALVWRQFKHPNILPLLGVNAELFAPSFCLISPWMENRDIITYLKSNPTHDRHAVFSDIAAGLLYLHSRDPPIAHGDIRGANILVTDDARCCLADFGLSLVITDSRSWRTTTTSAMKGAIRWMAPELIIQNSPNKPVPNNLPRDVYAFGCTVVEIITLQLPFHEQRTDAAVLYALVSGERPARPESHWCSDLIWNLTTWCWAEDSAFRPQARRIYEILRSAPRITAG